MHHASEWLHFRVKWVTDRKSARLNCKYISAIFNSYIVWWIAKQETNQFVHLQNCSHFSFSRSGLTACPKHLKSACAILDSSVTVRRILLILCLRGVFLSRLPGHSSPATHLKWKNCIPLGFSHCPGLCSIQFSRIPRPSPEKGYLLSVLANY